MSCEYIIACVDQCIFIFQIELSKYVAVNTATAHAHYEGEATYNIGSSFKGRPHYNIIKIHPQIGSGGESVVWCRRESEWELFEYSYVYTGGEKKVRKFISVGMCINVFYWQVSSGWRCCVASQPSGWPLPTIFTGKTLLQSSSKHETRDKKEPTILLMSSFMTLQYCHNWSHLQWCSSCN